MSLIKSGIRSARYRTEALINSFTPTRRVWRGMKRLGVKRSLESSPGWVQEVLDESAVSRLCGRFYGDSSATRVATVVDIGANLGQSAERFARMFPAASIYTIEPAQAVYDQLFLKFADNDRVSPLRYAMSDADGVVTLHHSEHSMCSALDAPWKETGTKETVDSRRLDTLCRELGVERIDILKVDTEGHDVRVLQGAESLLKAGAIDIVIVECGFLQGDPCHANFYEIAEFLKPFKFALSGFTETGNSEWIEEKFSLLYCNAIFARSS